jgi:hypothetical protein
MLAVRVYSVGLYLKKIIFLLLFQITTKIKINQKKKERNNSANFLLLKIIYNTNKKKIKERK